MLALANLDFVCFCYESVLLVRAIAERYEGGAAASAPSLNNLPLDYYQIGTILGRPYHNIRHTNAITSLPTVFTLASRPVLGL